MKRRNAGKQSLHDDIIYALPFIMTGIAIIFLVGTMNHSITGAAIGLSAENITFAERMIAVMEAARAELKDLGFMAVYFDDAIIEAKEALQKSDMKKILAISKDLEERKRIAVDLVAQLPILKADMNSQQSMGINMTDADGLYSNVGRAIKDERYADAQFELGRLSLLLKRQRSEYSRVNVLIAAGREGIIGFVRENYIFLSLLLAVLVVAGGVSYNRIMVQVTKARINDLDLEADVITSLMKKAQEDYFNRKAVSKSIYAMKAKQFFERLDEIRERRPMLIADLDYYKHRKLFELPKRKGGIPQ